MDTTQQPKDISTETTPPQADTVDQPTKDAAPEVPSEERAQEPSETLTSEQYQDESDQSSIIVKNIAQSTDPENPTTKQLTDFFSFCGNISSLTLVADESDDQTVSAVVTFENTSAARTALLLNHTSLNDKSIVVELAPYNLAVPPPESGNFPRHFSDSGPKTQESVIQNLLSQGYQVGVGALESARAYDEKHKISEQMNGFAKVVEGHVTAIDDQYQISGKVNHVVGQVTAIDEQYGISSGINEAVQNTIAQAQALDQQYHISESMQQTVSSAHAQVTQIDQQYQISESIISGAEKAVTEGAKLLSTVNEELRLEQRSKEAQEAINYGATQVAEFLETNETVRDIGTFFSSLGSSLWGSTVEESETTEITQDTAKSATQ